MAGIIESLKSQLEELQQAIRHQAALKDDIVCKLHEGQSTEANWRLQDDIDPGDAGE